MAPYLFHLRFYDIQSFPLKAPCREGRVSKVDYLLTHGERVNAMTMRGTTALGVAVHYNQYAVANRLLEWGANFIHRPSNTGNAELDFFCNQFFKNGVHLLSKVVILQLSMLISSSPF